jgi:hypothetical protein
MKTKKTSIHVSSITDSVILLSQIYFLFISSLVPLIKRLTGRDAV